MADLINKTKTIFLKYIKPYYLSIVGIFSLVIVAAVFGFIENLLNQYLLDEIIVPQRFERLLIFIFVYLGINAICLLLSYIVGRQNLNISQKCSIDMRTDLMMRIHQKDLSAASKWKSSEFIVRIMEDVTVVSGFFNNVIIGNAATVFTILIMMAYLIYYSWLIAAIVVVFSFAQLLVAWLFSKPLQKNQEIIKDVTQKHMSQLEDNITNLPLIKSFLLGGYMLRHYRDVLAAIRKISLKNYDTEYLLSLCTMTVGILCDVCVIVIGVNAIKAGGISIGVFVVILNTVVSVRSMVVSLANTNTYFQAFFVSLNRVFDLIHLLEETPVLAKASAGCPEGTASLEKEPEFREIVLHDIAFSYNPDTVVFSGLNLELKNNRINILSGASGTGKSTLIGLLLQLYQPDSGDISINGNCLSDSDQLRRQVSVCFQTDYFIQGSVYDNLKSVNPDRTDDEIQAALKVVEADAFLAKLPEGINSSIGEVQKSFSGGELKRISLARTLLKDAQLYIFDESFSSIDINTRKKVFSQVVDFLHDKIILISTHDLTLAEMHDVNLITL